MMDLIAYTDRRPHPGETLVGTGFVQGPGGKGFNQAVAAARAGASVDMVGSVGADLFGDEFLRSLAAEGIGAQGVHTREAAGTGVGLPVVSGDGQNAIIIVPRANMTVSADDIDHDRALLERASVVLLQLELPLETVRRAAHVGRQAGATVILNPAPFAPLDSDLLENVDIIIPNEIEFDSWAGLTDPSDQERIDAAHRLTQESRTTVLITLGSRGVLIIPPDSDPTLVPAHRVTPVDTIGAGDTFCGYVAALLSQGMELVKAVETANAASALAVTRRGGAASAPTLDEVQTLLQVRS